MTWEQFNLSHFKASCLVQATYTRLEIDENGSWNIMFIICLVKEDIFTVASLRSPFFEYSLFIDAMFSAQPLPIYRTHFNR